MPGVPAAPSLSELERIAARGWRGLLEQHLGDWVLRASGGFTGRANSVLGLGDPAVSFDRALAEVSGFYAAHGLPPLFQVPFDDRPESSPLTVSLVERGWQPFNASIVLTAPLPVARSAFPVDGTGLDLQHDAVPSADWLRGYHYRGRALPANAPAVLVSAETPPTFLTATAGGELAGVARGVLTDGWLGVTAVTVEPAFRRRGVGSALMGELIRWATAAGAHSAYLQVAVENGGALAMYARGGFGEHHRYHYLRQ